jgi:hypothetical protein
MTSNKMLYFALLYMHVTCAVELHGCMYTLSAVRALAGTCSAHQVQLLVTRIMPDV